MLLFASLSLVSCDDPKLPNEINEDYVQLTVGQEKELKYDGGKCIWTSDHNQIVEVYGDANKGTVKGIRRGIAYAWADEAHSVVEVFPILNTYVEPLMNWEATISDVKTIYSDEEILSDDKTNIVFKGKDNVLSYTYNFSESNLTTSALTLSLSSSIATLNKSVNEEELLNFLFERYVPVVIEEAGNLTDRYYCSPNKNIGVVLSVTDEAYVVNYYNLEAEANIEIAELILTNIDF